MSSASWTRTSRRIVAWIEAARVLSLSGSQVAMSRLTAARENQMRLELEDLERTHSGPGMSGRPMMVAIDSIEEDAGQPRLDFDDAALAELAETISRTGVKQPVSVRPKPNDPGRWILNFGARRLRASKLAGRTDIPAFVDESVDSYDQMIENEQREALKPLEVALFVQRRLLAGEAQADIARRLGKSRSYVTFATALIDAPDWLMELYRSGRCKGMQELYALRNLHQEHPASVEPLLAEGDPITRERVAAVKAALVPSQSREPSAAASSTPSNAVGAGDAVMRNAAPPPVSAPAVRRPISTIIVAVEHEGVAAELVVDEVPERKGDVFIRSVLGGDKRSVVASSVLLKSVVRR